MILKYDRLTCWKANGNPHLKHRPTRVKLRPNNPRFAWDSSESRVLKQIQQTGLSMQEITTLSRASKILPSARDWTKETWPGSPRQVLLKTSQDIATRLTGRSEDYCHPPRSLIKSLRLRNRINSMLPKNIRKKRLSFYLRHLKPMTFVQTTQALA